MHSNRPKEEFSNHFQMKITMMQCFFFSVSKLISQQVSISDQFKPIMLTEQRKQMEKEIGTNSQKPSPTHYVLL